MSEEQIQRGARFWLDDEGIIHGQEQHGTNFELSDAMEAMAAIRKLADGRKRGLLIDITNLRTMSREARAYFTKPEHAEVLHAVAMKIGSHFSRALGNIFLGLNKPATPTRLFNDDESALAWLRTFHRNGDRPSETSGKA
jgi:hypothetical protein